MMYLEDDTIDGLTLSGRGYRSFMFAANIEDAGHERVFRSGKLVRVGHPTRGKTPPITYRTVLYGGHIFLELPGRRGRILPENLIKPEKAVNRRYFEMDLTVAECKRIASYREK